MLAAINERGTVEFMHAGTDSTFLRLVASQEERNFLWFSRKSGRKESKRDICPRYTLEVFKRNILCARFKAKLIIFNPGVNTAL